MMIIPRSLVIVASASLLTACASTGKYHSVSPQDIEGEAWVLSSVNGEAPIDNRRITFRFIHTTEYGGRVAGQGPCNDYSGTYMQNEKQLSFMPLTTTNKRCSSSVMGQEKKYLSSFELVDAVDRHDHGVTLKSARGGTKLNFVPEDAVVKGVIHSSTGHFPGDATVLVQFVDMSTLGRENVIGESEMSIGYPMNEPVRFSVAYAPTLLKKGHTYGIKVQVVKHGKVVSKGVVKDVAGNKNVNIHSLRKPSDVNSVLSYRMFARFLGL